MKVLIIEDEKPAARRLQRLLKANDLQAEEMLHSVEESIEWFENNQEPDLIFLDIQLSDGLSFEIFEQVNVSSAIIFTTAYDEYALKAFKLNSIDYLLKPIDKEELVVAIEKFHSIQKPKDKNQLDLATIQQLLGTANDTSKNYKKRFVVKIGVKSKVIPIEDIECVYSENKATYIYTSDKRDYMIDQTLDQLENELHPETFFRVSRKFIIKLDAIEQMVSFTNSRLKLNLLNFNTEEIIVSREKVKAFKTWLG